MIEHGLYIVKQEYFNLVDSLGGDIDKVNGTKRPVYCCIKDTLIDGLYWAIPTSDLSHRSEEQKRKIQAYIALPEKDIRSSYYHIARTTRDAIFKVSSCYPITEKYIDHEYTTSGKHVVIRRAETVLALEKKIKKILSVESRKNNYFPQHITDIKNYLVSELIA